MRENTCLHCEATWTGRKRTFCFECLPAYGDVCKPFYVRRANELFDFKRTGRHTRCCGVYRVILTRPPKPLTRCPYCPALTKRKACESHREQYTRDNQRRTMSAWFQTEKGKAYKRRHSHGSRKRVAYVAARDGWTCALCHTPIDPSLTWPDKRCPSLDHTIPTSQGGTDDPSNWQLAHWVCNNAKSDGYTDRGEQLRLIG